MSQIKFIQEISGNLVTGKGTKIFPVTTTNAVYDSPTRTLKDIFYGEYDSLNTDFHNNGIYKWLDNLTEKSKSYVLSSDIKSLTSDVSVLKIDVVNTSKLLVKYNNGILDLSNTFGKEIERLENNMFRPEFDATPTKGSSKLLTSGSLYLYLSKIISKNIFDYPKVIDPDTYDADNGDIIINIGNSERYVFGGLYRALVSYTRNPDSMCHERIKSVQWEYLGNVLNDNDIDMSLYYTKTEVDNKLSLNKYIPGANININGNVISATIPDMSGFVTTDQLSSAINNIKPVTYTAGQNINISEDNVISATTTDSTIDETKIKEIVQAAVKEALEATKKEPVKVQKIIQIVQKNAVHWTSGIDIKSSNFAIGVFELKYTGDFFNQLVGLTDVYVSLESNSSIIRGPWSNITTCQRLNGDTNADPKSGISDGIGRSFGPESGMSFIVPPGDWFVKIGVKVNDWIWDVRAANNIMGLLVNIVYREL